MNDKRYEHTSANGTKFIAERADFEGGVRVYPQKGYTTEEIIQDTAQMIADHRGNIWPELNGFAGYDLIDFHINYP